MKKGNKKILKNIFSKFGYQAYLNDKDLIDLRVEYLNKSIKSVCFVAGEFGHKIFENDEVMEAIEKALHRGVKIDIVGGGNRDEKSVRLWRLVKDKKIESHRLEARPISHFDIYDGKHVRVEYYHPSGHSYSEKFERKGYFVSDSLSLSSNIQSEFDKLRNRAISQEKKFQTMEDVYAN